MQHGQRLMSNLRFVKTHEGKCKVLLDTKEKLFSPEYTYG